jgi:hypothetical protein
MAGRIDVVLVVVVVVVMSMVVMAVILSRGEMRRRCLPHLMWRQVMQSMVEIDRCLRGWKPETMDEFGAGGTRRGA